MCLGQVLGAMLDPAADKLLVASLVVPMAITGALPWWMTALIVGRDAGLMAVGFWHRFRTMVRTRAHTHLRTHPRPARARVRTVVSFVRGEAGRRRSRNRFACLAFLLCFG